MAATMLCPRCWGSKTEPGGAGACGYCHGIGAAPDQQLTPHFALSEMVVSSTAVRKGLANDPSVAHVERLTQVCLELLEPVRHEFGAVRVTSGLRLPAVNGAVSGAATHSAHCEAWAADFVPMDPRVTLKTVVDWIIRAKLPYDQVIYEGTWVHVGRFFPKDQTVRGHRLMMFPKNGRPDYTAYDPNDPRVV